MPAVMKDRLLGEKVIVLRMFLECSEEARVKLRAEKGRGNVVKKVSLGWGDD